MRDLEAGVRVPADYGDPIGEENAIRERRSVCDLSTSPELRLSGADRVRFLNGLVTCKLAAREPGELAYGFFTDAKGRILADGWFDLHEDSIRVELPPGTGSAILEHLAKYKIADRVDFELRALVRLELAGEDGRGLGLDPLPDGRVRNDELAGVPVRMTRRLVGGVPGVVLTADPDRAADLLDAVLDSRALVGHDARETVRVEAGRPRFGRDFGPENFPQETGLAEEAVAYDKGCYLGQEVVARIHYRGGVNRHLRGLRIDAEEIPPPDTDLLLDGRSVGTLTSVARSPRFEKTLGLGILHKRAEPGMELDLGGPDGEGNAVGKATVVQLPWRA